MCKNVFNNLRPNGRFVGINHNPDHPLTPLEQKKYGFTIEGPEPLSEGDKLIVTMWDQEKIITSFHAYFWKKKTYSEALTEAGFSRPFWHEPIVSEDGLKKFGKGFWNYCLNESSISFIETRKK